MARRRSDPKQGEVGLRLLFNTYRAGARTRNHEWALSEAQVRELTSQDCHYCGAAPAQVKTYAPSSGVSQERREFATYLYNGIDRVDNAKGYVVGNVVPACKTCNMSKHARGQAEFASWLQAAHEHNSQPMLAVPETEAFLKMLRTVGVVSFKSRDFEVTFDPMPPQQARTALGLDPDSEMAKQELQQAMERFRQTNKDEEADLLWSV